MDDVFIGRETELAEITAAIANHRLVTIVGPPGVGKTRLAAEATNHVGSLLHTLAVDLTAVPAPDAVAGALGVADAPSPTAIEAAIALAGEHQVLLSVDNCEHVLHGVVDAVGTLIDRCPNLCVLATSRRSLGIEGEVVVTLGPLVVADAVALFAARAGKAFVLDDTNADSVTDICRRLDGLPLAIELAAARTDVLSPHQLATLLQQRFSAVVADPNGTDPRHRTLDAAIGWSWDLLSVPEAALLRRLSVFAPGASAAAVRNVCAGTDVVTDDVEGHLRHLVEHSLVVAHDNRYRLLETIRHFARRQLRGAEESAEAHNRHAAWATALATEAEAHLSGPRQREWIARLDAEADNLRAALEWLIADEQFELALHLASTLTLWWRAAGALAEGRKWFLAALPKVEAPSIILGRSLFGAALLANVQGDLAHAWVCALESLRIGRRLANTELCARAMLVLGSCLLQAGPPGDGPKALRDCVGLARDADDPWCLTYALAILGKATGAPALLEDAIEVSRSTGDSIARAFVLNEMADQALVPADARELLDEALSFTNAGCPEHTAALIRMGRLELRHRDLPSAERYLDSAQREARQARSISDIPVTLHALARVASARGDLTGARDLLGQAVAIESQAGAPGIATGLSLARIAMSEGHLLAAADLVDRAESEARRLGITPQVAQALAVRADLLRHDGRIEEARAALGEALALLDSSDFGGLADCLDDLAGLAVTEGSYVLAVTLFGASAALRAERSLSIFPPDHPHYEIDLDAARRSLPVRLFDRTWASGGGLTVEAAVNLARQPEASPIAVSDELWLRLTEKELATVELVAEGLTDREISERLFIVEGSVKARLHSARAKLGSLTRSGLVNEVLRRQGRRGT